MGIFTIALASVLLPALSRAAATQQGNQFEINLNNSLRYTSFIILPFTFWMFIEALPITRLLFERGAFVLRDSHLTSQAIQAMTIGIWFTSCHTMLVRGFIARKDTVTPTLIGIAALCSNIFVGLSLMGPVTTTIDDRLGAAVSSVQQWLGQYFITGNMGAVGLAAASTASAIVSCALIVVITLYRHRELSLDVFTRTTTRALLASAAAAVAITLMPVPPNLILQLAASGVVFGLVYLGSMILLRAPETAEILGVIRSRIRRRARNVP
jgi:peptidoglycan biosynthesis protein MviN/MurJ (putative lipid II flippase)